MNRTIKFRAWDGEKIIYEFVVARPQFADCLSIMTDEEFAVENYNSITEWKVMQFTGLYDCEGKEIWEDDVVEYTQHHFNTDMTKVKRKVVKWNYDRWNIHETSAGESNIKVLGNIYEHPNLLNNESNT